MVQPNSLLVPTFTLSSISGLSAYCGYHEPIIRRFKRSMISGRDRWNKTCPPVEELLIELAHAFGFPQLPQAYWDSNGTLEFSKVGSRG